MCSCSKNLSAWHSFKYLFIWKIAYQLTSFLQHIITVIVLFESGNMAHTQTHKDIQTDRQNKWSVLNVFLLLPYLPWCSFLANSVVFCSGFVSCKKKNRNAKNMASAGARAYMGVWGRCPQRDPGAEPLVGVRGGRSPPEAEGILLPKRANLSLSFK